MKRLLALFFVIAFMTVFTSQTVALVRIDACNCVDCICETIGDGVCECDYGSDYDYDKSCECDVNISAKRREMLRYCAIVWGIASVPISIDCVATIAIDSVRGCSLDLVARHVRMNN